MNDRTDEPQRVEYATLDYASPRPERSSFREFWFGLPLALFSTVIFPPVGVVAVFCAIQSIYYRLRHEESKAFAQMNRCIFLSFWSVIIGGLILFFLCMAFLHPEAHG